MTTPDRNETIEGLLRLTEQLDAGDEARAEELAGFEAHAKAMSELLRDYGLPVNLTGCRQLVVVRCGWAACGQSIAAVYATGAGPLYHASIHKQPFDDDLPPGERPDELASGFRLPEIDESLMMLIHSDDRHDIDEEDDRRPSSDEMDDSVRVWDLLEWENPAGPTWHPPLIARCRTHPSQIHTLDREAISHSAKNALRRGRVTIVVGTT